MAGGNGVDGLAMREYGDVCFAVWTGAGDAMRMRALSDFVANAAQRNSGSIVLCQYIHPSSKPPDATGRAEAMKLLKRNEGALRRMVTVPLGDAMWVGVVRSIMRGFFVLLRRADILVVASNEATSIQKVLEVRSPRTPPAAVLHEAVTEIFAESGIDPRTIGRAAS